MISCIYRPILFVRRSALAGILPDELSALLLQRRKDGVVPPLAEHFPEVVQLVSEPEAAVGVHGGQAAQVVAELAEAAEGSAGPSPASASADGQVNLPCQQL